MIRKTLFFLAIALIGCTGRKTTTDGINLQLNNYKKESGKTKLSNYVHKLVYIQLDTKKECLVNGIREIKISDDHIFITDFDDNFFHFKKNGSYINRLEKGKGPGEIIELADFCLIPEKQQIGILNKSSKLDIITFSGEYVKTIDINHRATDILWLENYMFALYVPKKFSHDSTCVIICDYNGKTIKQIKYTEIQPEERRSAYLDFINSFWYSNGQIVYLETSSSDYLYLLGPDWTRKEYLCFNLKDRQLPFALKSKPEEYRNNRARYIELSDFIKVRDNLFFSFTHKNCYNNAIYNSKSKKLVVLDDCNKGLYNDLSTLTPYLWPVSKTDKDEFIFVAYPNKFLKDEKASQSFKMLKKKPELEDNPVIIIGKE